VGAASTPAFAALATVGAVAVLPFATAALGSVGGNALVWGGVGAVTNGAQQGGEMGAYRLSDGDLGREKFSFGELSASIAIGAGLGALGEIASPYLAKGVSWLQGRLATVGQKEVITSRLTAEELAIIAGEKTGLGAGQRPGEIDFRSVPPLETAVVGSEERMVMVYRGTNIGIENQMYDASGHLFSDAARQGFYETGTVEGAYSRAEAAHQQWIDVLGGEARYVEAHSSQGLELSGNHGGLDRTFISVTDSLSEATRFANGGRLYGGLVRESTLLRQTLGTAGENEYLIRFGTNQLKPIGSGGVP